MYIVKKNVIASTMTVIGVALIVISIILSLVIFKIFGVIITLLAAALGCIVGFLFIGFGENIKLIHELNERDKIRTD